jgi:(E)-4-hydroxy-3-methylbut-2-enyl-diphosphate synthase
MAGEVERRLRDLRVPISVAVMGCVVNGPGEARDADIGIACGRGRGVIFAGGEPLRTVKESELVDELFVEIARRYSL